MRWFLGNLAEGAYLGGEWDEALELAEREIADEQHYLQSNALRLRALIRIARGDLSGAAEDATIALREGRAIRDRRFESHRIGHA